MSFYLSLLCFPDRKNYQLTNTLHLILQFSLFSITQNLSRVIVTFRVGYVIQLVVIVTLVFILLFCLCMFTFRVSFQKTKTHGSANCTKECFKKNRGSVGVDNESTLGDFIWGPTAGRNLKKHSLLQHILSTGCRVLTTKKGKFATTIRCLRIFSTIFSIMGSANRWMVHVLRKCKKWFLQA